MNKNLRYLFIVLGIVIVGFVLWYFKSIVAYVLISAVLALIGRPAVEFLKRIRYKRLRIPNALSALLTLVLLWALLLLFFRVFIPLIANQASELSSINPEVVIKNLEGPIDYIENLIDKYNLNSDEHKSLDNYLTDKFVSIVNISMLSGFFGSLAGLLGNIFIAAFSISFITFFFLKDPGLLYNAILILIPDKYQEQTKHILASIKKLLTRYFIGILVQITGIITLVSIGLTIIGIAFSDALLIGLVVGLMNIIPYLGPIIGACLGLILGLATHLYLPFYSELLPLLGYMTIVFIIVQVVDNVFFQPVIYSSSVNAHPMEIFLVIMMAASLFGITGMILAIPSYTILRVIAKEFFNNLKVVKKLTEKI